MNTKIIILLAGLFLTASAAEANTIARTTGKKVIMETKSLHSESINMQIFDAFGDLIWEVTGENYLGIKTFNIESLPVGNYSLEVSDSNKRLVQPIEINSNSTISLGEEKIFFRPSVNIIGDVIHLNALSLGSDVTFEITDDANNSVYKSHYENQQTVQKVYNLQSLPSGTYFISTTVAGRSYSKRFDK
ncbi:MAG: hypothetical protein IPM42_06860 [Saprospiraceae bacterium]|nr:hypothetical protein [Saprospiraceae bacterium]